MLPFVRAPDETNSNQNIGSTTSTKHRRRHDELLQCEDDDMRKRLNVTLESDSQCSQKLS
jgi:hypothetical protein